MVQNSLFDFFFTYFLLLFWLKKEPKKRSQKTAKNEKTRELFLTLFFSQTPTFCSADSNCPSNSSQSWDFWHTKGNGYTCAHQLTLPAKVELKYSQLGYFMSTPTSQSLFSKNFGSSSTFKHAKPTALNHTHTHTQTQIQRL